MNFRQEFSELIKSYPSMLSNKKAFETTMKSYFREDKQNCNITIALYDSFADIQDADEIDSFLTEYLVSILVDDYGTKEDAARQIVEIVLEAYGHEYLNKPYAFDILATEEDEDVEETVLETWDDESIFTYVLDKFNKGNYRYAFKLVECYNKGIGVDVNKQKALEVCSTLALKVRDKTAIRELSDAFYIGEVIPQDVDYTKELDLLVDKNADREAESEAGRALIFQKIESREDAAYKAEVEHFEEVEEGLDRMIKKYTSYLREIDTDISWMDYDQKADWREKRARNAENGKKIEEYSQMYLRPYYARMNVTGPEERSVYIGERRYVDDSNPENEIVSVWSEMGRQYRQRTVNKFEIDGTEYRITLRRKISIKDAELTSINDEYRDGIDVSETQITDPFLQKVLAEKKKERNISNIIRSIQLNQNNIIEEDMDRDIVVQGCAGSGKTMVLLHRLANLKYNKPDYMWENVRIITPNKEFAFYIDDLSKNLEIDSIRKCTLEEYMLEIFRLYYVEFHTSSDNISGKEWKKRFGVVKSDEEWSKDSGAAQFIYSDKFMAMFDAKMKHTRLEEKVFKKAYRTCLELVKQILSENGYTNRIPFCRALLILELLFMKRILGSARIDERLLCVDEGQDIPERCYLVLKELSDNKCVFNIYGDMAQRVNGYINASGWDKVVEAFDAKKYELKENYRNSEQIVRFYKEKLGREDESFGMSTREVQHIDELQLRFWMQLHLVLGNRVAFITRNPAEFCDKFSDITSRDRERRKVNVLTVREVKGLEYDTVFVSGSGLGENDQYIAYTRALSNLFVVK